MQAVFAGSAVMLFVPVLFHGQAPSEVGTVPAGTGAHPAQRPHAALRVPVMMPAALGYVLVRLHLFAA